MAQVDRRRFLGLMGAAAGTATAAITGLSCRNGESENSRIHKEFNDAFDLLFDDVNRGRSDFFQRSDYGYGVKSQFGNDTDRGTLILEKNIRPSKILGADIEELHARTIRIYMETGAGSEMVATWQGQSPLWFLPAEQLNNRGYVAPREMRVDEVQRFLARVRTIVDSIESK